MTTKDTGGPAFPQIRELGASFMGISLRDYFAAKAMQPLIAGRNWNHFKGTDEELIAHWAKASYVLADAMLAERNKP